MRSEPTIYIVDDESAMRHALQRLLQPKYVTRAFCSGLEFLEAYEPDTPGCIILDVAMPDFDGLDVQAHLREMGCRHPIIFLSAYGTIATSVRALRAGAFDFLIKPVSAEIVLATVREALEAEAANRGLQIQRKTAMRRLATLSPRELQVLDGLVDGRLNKQIAAGLGIGESTVKAHRRRIMEKLQARGVAEIVRVVTSACEPQSVIERIGSDSRNLAPPPERGSAHRRPP